jgi:hypothetical protein
MKCVSFRSTSPHIFSLDTIALGQENSYNHPQPPLGRNEEAPHGRGRSVELSLVRPNQWFGRPGLGSHRLTLWQVGCPVGP